jgi:hypothetical protein
VCDRSCRAFRGDFGAFAQRQAEIIVPGGAGASDAPHSQTARRFHVAPQDASSQKKSAGEV